jgi:hypothetical protein
MQRLPHRFWFGRHAGAASPLSPAVTNRISVAMALPTVPVSMVRRELVFRANASNRVASTSSPFE